MKKARMAPSCYYTCSLVPVSMLAAAGYRPARLMPREPLVQSCSRNVLTPHSTSCPYVRGLLPLAEAALDSEPMSRAVIPSACDAMRRAGDLLAAAFPQRVFALRMPRCAGDRSAGRLAAELTRLWSWLDADPTGEPLGPCEAEPQLCALSYPAAMAPGGVFVISGPLDNPALLDLLVDLGAGLSGVDSCSAPERQLSPQATPGTPGFLALADALLDTAVCPRRPALERKPYLRRRWDECRPAAVLYARHSFCDPGAYDVLEVAQLAEEAGLPFMEVEVGLPVDITGPLRTRVEAFLETLLLDF